LEILLFDGGRMTIGTISIIVGIVLLILLKAVFKDEKGSFMAEEDNGITQDDLFREEPGADPSWSLLPGNVWYSEDD
jgi:hypothetical protein